MIDIQAPRLRFEVKLAPALGSGFQPTGFPDIGAATFETYGADGTLHDNLLVESPQSMANRLEASVWDAGAQQPHELIADLPYVRVCRTDAPEEFLTSSRLEAHRLASAFIRDARLDGTPMLDIIGERLGLAKDTPLNYPRMARTVLQLDPFCLIHGVFFAHRSWLGQPKFPRAISALIEAHDVQPLQSGGRKADSVRHQLDKDGDGGGTSEGYGSVPFHRTDYTARDITAYFSLDLELLRSYGLGNELTELLAALALWEARRFLTTGLRLRTGCDLIITQDAEQLPQEKALTGRITQLLTAQHDAIGARGPLTVLWDETCTKSNAKNKK
ncbi:type I-U CRISPR-associated RAMP protein Csb1/Cas7u [Streptomyces sp. NPDC059080]|uniref:type I-G CRISPR-associated RAMP protein Csb1/Cas7g n=1 Tax=Streptomyces sp. NPDC059080 TaxID=3346718 RepID=UPI00369DB457